MGQAAGVTSVPASDFSVVRLFELCSADSVDSPLMLAQPALSTAAIGAANTIPKRTFMYSLSGLTALATDA